MYVHRCQHMWLMEWVLHYLLIWTQTHPPVNTTHVCKHTTRVPWTMHAVALHGNCHVSPAALGCSFQPPQKNLFPRPLPDPYVEFLFDNCFPIIAHVLATFCSPVRPDYVIMPPSAETWRSPWISVLWQFCYGCSITLATECCVR